MRGKTESLGGSGGERGEDLREGHAGAGHELELFCGVVVVDIADVCTEENLAAGGCVGVELIDDEREEVLRRFSGNVGPLSFDVEEGERGDEAHVRGLHAVDERGRPGTFVSGDVGEDIDATVERDLDAFDAGRMGEDELVVAVGFGDDRA